jgi:hypothetical protein
MSKEINLAIIQNPKCEVRSHFPDTSHIGGIINPNI